MIKHFFTKQFLIFLATGGLAAFLNWFSRIVLSNWLQFSWAVVCAYGVGMFVAFTLNSLLVFPQSAKPKHKQARDFVIVNLFSFPVVLIAAIVIEHILQLLGFVNYRQALAHGVAVALPVFVTFLIYKFFAFREKI